jgi:hypothetical protein
MSALDGGVVKHLRPEVLMTGADMGPGPEAVWCLIDQIRDCVWMVAAYRKLAAKRAKDYGLPPPSAPENLH